LYKNIFTLVEHMLRICNESSDSLNIEWYAIPIVYQPLRIFTANRKSSGRIYLKYLNCMFEHQELSDAFGQTKIVKMFISNRVIIVEIYLRIKFNRFFLSIRLSSINKDFLFYFFIRFELLFSLNHVLQLALKKYLLRIKKF